jgi:hypothetical protein
MMSIDVLIDSPLSFQKMWESREKRQIEDMTVNIVSIDHLIEMKKHSRLIYCQMRMIGNAWMICLMC